MTYRAYLRDNAEDPTKVIDEYIKFVYLAEDKNQQLGLEKGFGNLPVWT